MTFSRRAFLSGIAKLAAGATLARLMPPAPQALLGDGVLPVDIVFPKSAGGRELVVSLIGVGGIVLASQTCRQWEVTPEGKARNLAEIAFPVSAFYDRAERFDIRVPGDAEAFCDGDLTGALMIGPGITPVFDIGELVVDGPQDG